MKSEPKHNDSNQIIQKEWERMLTEDFDKPEASAFASIDMYIFTYRVSPKKGDLRLNAHKTPCKCTTGCPTKNYTLFWRAIAPINFKLGTKVWGILESF